MALESRQLHKQCFSPFLVPLFSQKHSCTTLPERWGGRGSRQRRPLVPPGVSRVSGAPFVGGALNEQMQGLLCAIFLIPTPGGSRESHGTEEAKCAGQP